jgi:hypothetical protein
VKRSRVSRAINTAFIERHNGTERNRNARKVHKTYCFSKDWQVHEAVTYLSMYSYNFCWEVRTLRESDEKGRWRARTPAMAAGLADHVWSLTQSGYLSQPFNRFRTPGKTMTKTENTVPLNKANAPHTTLALRVKLYPLRPSHIRA